ncbi:MAG: CRISPR-associated protein Cas5 [Bacteroidales bacterium]|nr:CRISPR-associated protein Cas5 [Bacteroidales bacterium]MCF8345498.1 CRISPR-associated protein Cas5 [Bacteroidales bacterium]MCF8351169.1 CRISPR-associated protein Cas5 [Bacteroidales bacterium]MCF8377689.1 CRISPR-associated protein Cas5 [Bacteroidales bacterium]
MKAIQFILEGNWGHFKRPETNNNPLTYDFITKTALIGLIGAVLGKTRSQMIELFPVLSESLLYGLKLLNPVKKISWGFTSSSAINPTEPGNPKYFEFLEKPRFEIVLSLFDNKAESVFDDFKNALSSEMSFYTPVLGWHNCPANLKLVNEGVVSNNNGDFNTGYFVEKGKHSLNLIGSHFRIGFDKVPTFQEDFWNKPEYFKEVVYPDAGNDLSVKGEYYELSKTNEQLWMI